MAALDPSSDFLFFIKTLHNQQYTVDMFETKVIFPTHSQDHLSTIGLGPCVGIGIIGELNTRPFIALHHWDANLSKECDPGFAILNMFSNYAYKIFQAYESINPDDDIDHPIYIKSLNMIGGQKECFSNDGTQELSGTEFGVTSFIEHLESAIKGVFDTSKLEEISVDPFVTSGDETVNLKLSLNAKEIKFTSKIQNPSIKFTGFGG